MWTFVALLVFLSPTQDALYQQRRSVQYPTRTACEQARIRITREILRDDLETGDVLVVSACFTPEQPHVPRFFHRKGEV